MSPDVPEALQGDRRAGELPPAVHQDAIRGRIRGIIERLARLREGQFGFNVSEEAPSRIGDRDLAGEMLEDGINPEGLMLDLARQLDEDRRESSAALEASLAVPPVQRRRFSET